LLRLRGLFPPSWGSRRYYALGMLLTSSIWCLLICEILILRLKWLRHLCIRSILRLPRVGVRLMIIHYLQSFYWLMTFLLPIET
jgi:hypothetical protein